MLPTSSRCGALLLVCLPALAQITGTVTSVKTGDPVAQVTVMGEGLNWTTTDANGHFSLPRESFRGLNAPPETPVSFRSAGYRPLTLIAPAEFSVLDVQLEDGAATQWNVQVCQGERRRGTIGFEMQFTVPAKKVPGNFSDVDYSGQTLTFEAGGRKYTMGTMSGGTCCSGHPLRRDYLDSAVFEERAWIVTSGKRTFDGLDARGTAKDGTKWR